MATLHISEIEPLAEISKKAIPFPLAQAIQHIFLHSDENLWLVGGTALAGFYAEHRRSDDLDLFATTPESYNGALLAVKSLARKGAIFSNESQTPFYYHAVVSFLNHSFTIDVVLDENLKKIGSSRLASGIRIASFKTLFMMKLACLVSRASEKDFFDLSWFFKKIPTCAIEDVVALGSQVDAGLNTESLLISLSGSTLREESCHFLLPHSEKTAKKVFQEIQNLQKKLIAQLRAYEDKLPHTDEVKSLSESVKMLKRLKKQL